MILICGLAPPSSQEDEAASSTRLGMTSFLRIVAMRLRLYEMTGLFSKGQTQEAQRVYETSGWAAIQQWILEQLLELKESTYVDACDIAFQYAKLDRRDEAFELGEHEGEKSSSGRAVA